MTDAEQLAEWLADESLAFVQEAGGYPNDVAVIAGHVIVASCRDECEPELDVYHPAYVREWVENIRDSMEEEPDEDLSFHLWENAPPEKRNDPERCTC